MRRFGINISCISAVFLIVFSAASVFPVYAEIDPTEEGNPHFSSAQLHKRREGVILPLFPQTMENVVLNSVTVSAKPDFFACHVRNLKAAVRAEFEVSVSNPTSTANIPLAFPLTTHALYGDHNQINHVRITVNGIEINHRAAMDYDLWAIADDGVYYKGRHINYAVHPVFENAANLRNIAPHLVQRGYDLVLFWYIPNTGASNVTQIAIDYTYSSNDFSYCCKEVRECALSTDPLYFYFDLNGANAWPGQKDVTLVFPDSARALWSGVPKTGLQTRVSDREIVLSGTAELFPNISIPIQPATFSCQPRAWFPSPSPVQEFTLQWNKECLQMGIDSVLIERIEGVGGITVTAELPIRLSRENPAATFIGAYELPISQPAYIDIAGSAYYGSYPDSLHSGWQRISLAGRPIMGHDLEIKNVHVQRDAVGQYQVTAETFNAGQFTEPLTMTVNINNEFVRAERFRCLIEPGQTKSLSLTVEGNWPLPADFEVEIEPSPGEVNRLNNAMTVTYPSFPRRENYTLRPDHSKVTLITPDGQIRRSPLHGGLKLYLGDPDVPVIALAGMLGVSVDGAVLYAPDIDLPSLTSLRPPRGLYMFKDPTKPAIGSTNYLTGEIHFELYLKSRQGEIPAQQPMRFSGRLTHNGLFVQAVSAEPDAPKMRMEIVAHKTPPPVKPELWFSTKTGFNPSLLLSDSEGNIPPISDGDLLSTRGYIVAKNHELTARLGIMPIVPDLGLSAVTPGPRGEIWFSFDKENGQIWSETLGRYLQHGDLLSNTGRVVQANQQLTFRFRPIHTDVPNKDLGLDAVALAYMTNTGEIYFSTTENFFSQALNRHIGHGDFLSNRGRIVKTNQELLTHFSPIEDLADFGLDAVILRPDGEIWFSVEFGFNDSNLGPVSDGDVLSSSGYVVARNPRLLGNFKPAERDIDLGLDALAAGFVDVSRYDYFPAGFGGDIDGDGVVDFRDFGILAEQWRTNYDVIDLTHLAQDWLE